MPARVSAARRSIITHRLGQAPGEPFQRAAHGITSISFAPDGQLAAHHDARLDVAHDGTWTWQPVREESPAHERA
jgi:hypothetical protein